jgi:hypothetical protein
MCTPPGAGGHLGQPLRVRRIRRADDEHDVGLWSDGGDRLLAILRGVADVVAAWPDCGGVALLEVVDDAGDLVGRQRRLVQVGDTLGRADVEGIDVGCRGDDRDPLRCLAERALDLLVILVADQHDVVVALGEAAGLGVDLAHQRAGGVDHDEVPLGGAATDLGRDAVSGEHERGAGRDVVDLLHEDGPLALELGDDVGVVDDLAPDVDRLGEPVDGPLDDVDRPLDAGAERPWPGQQHRPWPDDAGPSFERRHHLGEAPPGKSDVTGGA